MEGAMTRTVAEKLASDQLQQLDITASDFVHGFLLKCAAAEYGAADTLSAMQAAMAVSPHVAREFKLCGLEKAAFGSPGMAAGMAAAAKLPAAPKITPPKIPATYKPGPSSPDLSVSGEFVRGVGNGMLNEGRRISGLARAGTANLLKPVTAVGKHVIGPVGDATGLTENLTPAFNDLHQRMQAHEAAGIADQDASNAPDAYQTASKAWAGTKLHRNNTAWQRQMGFNTSANVADFANNAHELASVAIPGAVVGKAPGLLSKALPSTAALGGTAYAADLAQPWLDRTTGVNADGTSKIPISPSALSNWIGTSVDHTIQGQPQPPMAVADWASAKQNPEMASAEPAQSGPGAPAEPQVQQLLTDQQPAEMEASVTAPPKAQPPQASPQPAAPATPPPPPQATTPQPTVPPAQPQAQPAPAAGQPDPAAGQPPAPPPSVVTQTPEYAGLEQLVKQDPDTAHKLGEEALKQAGGVLSSPEGKVEVESVMTNGALTPQGQQKALTAFSSNGTFDQATAFDNFSKMDPWEQLGLVGGLSMTALGLLHALSGGSGIGSLLMGVLGLGAAGFTAAKGGLLDQGSQDMANQAQSALTGLFSPAAAAPSQPAVPPPPPQAVSTQPAAPGAPAVAGIPLGDAATLQAQAPALVDSLPPEPTPQSIKQLQELVRQYPTEAAQMDTAAGNGILSGVYASQAQAKLGLNPEQWAKLVKHWPAVRAAAQ